MDTRGGARPVGPRSHYEEFTPGAKKTIEGLEGMAQFLKKAAETFRNVDTELSSALKG